MVMRVISWEGSMMVIEAAERRPWWKNQIGRHVGDREEGIATYQDSSDISEDGSSVILLT
jgi:hypothetical protein